MLFPEVMLNLLPTGLLLLLCLCLYWYSLVALIIILDCAVVTVVYIHGYSTPQLRCRANLTISIVFSVLVDSSVLDLQMLCVSVATPYTSPQLRWLAPSEFHSRIFVVFTFALRFKIKQPVMSAALYTPAGLDKFKHVQ